MSDLPPTTAERWLPVPGYEGLYEVSDAGRVRSLRYRNGHKDAPRPEPLVRSPIFFRGYRKIALSKNDKSKYYGVHRLVLSAFVGPCPDGMEGAHLNGNPLDNRLSNLQWVTPRENMSHKEIHGTLVRGTRVQTCKLTESAVLEIRRKFEIGAGLEALAREYGISVWETRLIVQRQRWKHV